MESRIQILDRLSKKFGEKDVIENFEDFCNFYNADAILNLVYIAMNQYAIQEKKEGNEDVFRNFIRQEHLSAKWEQYLNDNEIDLK